MEKPAPVDAPVDNSCSCLYSNVDSLLNKRHELEAIISSFNPTIIALTEIMPKNAKNVDMNEFNIDNYDKFINNVPHRGVLIYVHKRVNATMMTVESKYDEFIEYTMCEIKTLNTGVNLLFVCVYRSPNSDPDNNANLLNLLTGIDKHPAKLKCIVGDFNLPGIDWRNGETKDQFSAQFYASTLDLFLHQNITQTTRNKHAQTPSLIDLILTNDNHMVNDIKHIAPLGKSDHDVILFNLNLHIDTYLSPEIVFYNKGDYDNFRSFVDCQDWEVLTDANIEDTWSMIKDTLNQGTSEFVPKCKIKNTYKPPWLNKSATKAIKSKQKAYKNYLANKTHYNEFKYKMMRNAVTTEVRAAKKYFEQRIAKESKDNPKAFWKYVKSKTVCKTNVGNLKYNGKMAETDMEKAEMLNLFFSNVYTDEDPTMPDVNTSPADYFICDIRVTPECKKQTV